MRRTFWLFAVLILTLASPTRGQDDNPLATDNDLPGRFHPFNVTGKYKNKFHCLVSEFGLDPVVMVFVRGIEANNGVKYLMVKLDNAIDKNRALRLKGAVIFLGDDLDDAVKDDDKREALALKVQDIEKATMIQNVVLALDSKKDLAKYKLPEDAGVVVVVYNRYRILFSQSYAADKFTEDEAKKVLGEIAAKFKLKS
jgi:hypothetical protein